MPVSLLLVFQSDDSPVPDWPNQPFTTMSGNQMAIEIDWEAFRDRFAILRAWIKEWDHCFVANKPASKPECYQQFRKHEHTIADLRNSIEAAKEACASLLEDAGVARDRFFYRQLPNIGHFPKEKQRKIYALRAGTLAIFDAERLVDKSLRAENYSFLSWDLLHNPDVSKDVFVNTRGAVEHACWLLLPEIENAVRRSDAARRAGDRLKIDLSTFGTESPDGDADLSLWKVAWWLNAFGGNGSPLPWKEVRKLLRLHCRELFPERERDSATYPSERTRQLGVKAVQEAGWCPVRHKPPSELPETVLCRGATSHASE